LAGDDDEIGDAIPCCMTKILATHSTAHEPAANSSDTALQVIRNSWIATVGLPRIESEAIAANGIRITMV
jgi:hypothetical protein